VCSGSDGRLIAVFWSSRGPQLNDWGSQITLTFAA